MQKASLIVTSYNYERYLRAAIDSALQQNYPNKEVIVVDDGSTDGSPAIIASYGDQITAIFKENGGEATSCQAGFQASRGDVIFLIDSDDRLLPGALENVMPLFSDPRVSKVHFPLRIIDEHGRPTGVKKPKEQLPEGDLRQAIIEDGPTSCISPPTTGNAWARSYLSQVLPVPAGLPYYNCCVDEYLFTLAPLYGEIRRLREPQGDYRVHGKSFYSSKTFEAKLAIEVNGYREQSRFLESVLCRMGISADVARWEQRAWFLQLDGAVRDIGSICAPEGRIILVDEGKWGTQEIAGRKCVPFPERDGRYWGLPPDSDAAIHELERLRLAGAHYLIFTWATFWWLDNYPEFHRYVRTRFPSVLDNRRVMIFELKDRTAHVQS